MQKITNNIFVETEFQGCNTGFVVTKEGIVMIDTPQMPEDAIKWRDEIANHREIRYVINTEPHGDHFTGNYFFDGAVIAHEGTRKAILDSSVKQLEERLNQTLPEGFNYRPPTITFSHRLTFYLGDHTFELIHAPGHTPYQVMVHIPEEKVLFTSDNIVYRGHGSFRHSLPYEWLDSLKLIQELDVDILVPGHGNICDRSYIAEMRAFIQAWIDAITAAIKQGMSLNEAQDKISLLDYYPIPAGSETRALRMQRMNVERLYEVLKKS